MRPRCIAGVTRILWGFGEGWLALGSWSLDPLHVPAIAGVSPGGWLSRDKLFQRSVVLYDAGLRMLILREPAMSSEVRRELVSRLATRCPELRIVLHEKCPGVMSERSEADSHFQAETQTGCIHRSGAYFRDLPEEMEPKIRVQFGVSCHEVQEIERVRQEGATYAFYSPIWKPNSKPGDTRPPLGPGAYESVIDQSLFPVFALGGVDAQRVLELQHPRSRVAILGALFAVDQASALNTLRAVQQHIRSISAL